MAGVALTAVFLVVVPLIVHFLFSWMGFNPTDDGFTLAYSRRIVEGQIPHRDFIIIRPFLSPLIHVPFVLWGGVYTFWLSRLFVWAQLAGISLLWVSIIGRLLGRSFTAPVTFLLALSAFVVSAHDFPIMAWHTIDGLLFVSLGLWFCIGRKSSVRWIGYLLIGAACLCKQNFSLMVPAALFILGDWRKTRYWLAAAAPAVIYFAFVAVTGASADAFVQLSSHSDLFSTGVFKYFRRWMPVGLLVGYFALSFLLDPPGKRPWIRNNHHRRVLGMMGVYGLPVVGVAVSLVCGYLFKSSFILFGIVAGVLLYGLKSSGWRLSGRLRAVMLVLSTAWCISISVGYNSPVLLAGPLLILVLLTDTIVARPTVTRLGQPAFLIGVAAFVVAGFTVGRYTHIYRERSVTDLTERVDAVLPGGALIKTNPRTFQYLTDLRTVIDSAGSSGFRYILLPGSAGLWVKSKQSNPLPIDWVQETELNRQKLADRVLHDLELLRDSTIVIVQKIELKRLADEFKYVPDDEYHAVVRHIRDHYAKIGETPYHELYR